MWGLGLIMLCLLAFVIIGVVSNVTLTNQQDYYGVKQTSEASSYDAVDTVSYKKGICVCAAEGTTKNADGQYAISKRTQYTITEPDDNNNCESKERCELRLGEYVIDPKLFNENIIVRLGSIIKASEVYDIKVQEIIPYPPKISVYISYHQALNVDGDDRINSEIPNKFDGIFEDTGTQSVLKYQETVLSDWPLSCGTPDTNTYCYYDKDGNVSSNKWKFCPELTDESKCKAAGYEEKVQVSSTSNCNNVCFCKGTQCGVYANVNWGGGWQVADSSKCNQEPAKEPEPAKETEQPKSSQVASTCKYKHYHMTKAKCCNITIVNGKQTCNATTTNAHADSVSFTGSLSESSYSAKFNSEADKACRSKGYSIGKGNIRYDKTTYYNYNVYYWKNGKKEYLCRKIEASSGTNAIKGCGSCAGMKVQCSAECTS